jgi:hypothetical protein
LIVESIGSELERDYPKATPGTVVTAVIARVAGRFVAQTLTRGIKRIITSVERNKMPFVLSLDTGISSGVALLEYGDDLPATLVEAWQFPGGVKGLADWFFAETIGNSYDTANTRWDVELGVGVSLQSRYGDQIICERFTARSTSGFSYTTASLEPLECQGFLKAHGLMPFDRDDPRWRDPKYMYFAGGKDKADKKKRMHGWLKDHGFYVTGKQLGTPDADDCRSAIAHAIAYLRGIEHGPTLKEYFS